MSSIARLKGEHVHTRMIHIQTFRAGDGRLLVEGTLDDKRHINTHTLDGRPLKDGPYHGMIVRFLVSDFPPKIIEVDVEMPLVPSDDCRKVEEMVKKLEGLSIVYGYSKAVKDLLGGIKGCTHVNALILAMGSAVIQGTAGSRRDKGVSKQDRYLMSQYMKNSCWGWREDGPFFEKIGKKIEEDQAED